ncbi:MAG: hypothetical protein IJP48_00170 [Synergistaceae bacterium]|nr:hypothetical protein [Synergistaceae bacterium]
MICRKYVGWGGARFYHIDPLPWPLITLLRFHYFTRFKDEIINNDYLMFANSNLVCRKTITEEEFLPDDSQELTVGIHYGFWNLKPRFFTYERDRKSRAYIPYNIGKNYMMGALMCGRTDNFMKMSETLKTRINEDLADRKIALWHDESHFNKYVLENRKLRVLTPSYGYAEGVNLPFEMKMELLDKRKHFDVSLFKRDESLALHKVLPKVTLLFRIKRKLKRILKRWKINFLYWRDTLLRRHI